MTWVLKSRKTSIEWKIILRNFKIIKAEMSKPISQVLSNGLIYIVYLEGGKLVFLLLPASFQSIDSHFISNPYLPCEDNLHGRGNVTAWRASLECISPSLGERGSCPPFPSYEFKEVWFFFRKFVKQSTYVPYKEGDSAKIMTCEDNITCNCECPSLPLCGGILIKNAVGLRKKESGRKREKERGREALF